MMHLVAKMVFTHHVTNASDFVRDKVSEVELDMSETWSESRKYSSGLVRSGPVRSL